MPRNFSELKSGGTILMLSSHAEKLGEASPRPPPAPPVPHRSTPVIAGGAVWCPKGVGCCAYDVSDVDRLGDGWTS